jgi:hypothetical protein
VVCCLLQCVVWLWTRDPACDVLHTTADGTPQCTTLFGLVTYHPYERTTAVADTSTKTLHMEHTDFCDNS